MVTSIKVTDKEISFEDMAKDMADNLADEIDAVLVYDFNLSFEDCDSLNYRGILAEIGKIWAEKWKDEPLYRSVE